MKNLKEYTDYLESKGYELGYTSYCDGSLYAADYLHDNLKFSITLYTQETEEYNKYLTELFSDGDEHELEFKEENFIVNGALIHCPYRQHASEGIMLRDNTKVFHGLEYFEKCVWIQQNAEEYEMQLFESHVKNMKYINKVIAPVLKECDFAVHLTTLSQLTDDTSVCGESDLFIEYKHPNSITPIILGTDCVSGELFCVPNLDVHNKTKEEVKEIFMNYFKGYLGLDTKWNPYGYLWDSEQDINSYKKAVEEKLQYEN